MRNRLPISWKKEACGQGGCALCPRSKLAPDGRGLVYPYDWVWVLDLGPFRVAVCAECLPGVAAVVLDAEADANPAPIGAYQLHEAIEEVTIIATHAGNIDHRRRAALELKNLAETVSEMVKRAS